MVRKFAAKLSAMSRDLLHYSHVTSNLCVRCIKPLTRRVAELIERFEASSVEFVVRLEDDAKEFVVGRDPCRLLDAAVARHLPVDGLVVRELEIIARRACITWPANRSPTDHE